MADNVACQSPLTSFEEVFGPFVIEPLGNAFLATQLGDALLTAKAIQHNPDLFFRAVLLTGLAFDIFDDPFAGR